MPMANEIDAEIMQLPICKPCIAQTREGRKGKKSKEER